MILGGFQKSSLIDYPGKTSCVLFIMGCNFDCPYCHNAGLVRGDQEVPAFLNEKWLFDFLEKRKGLLDGVVITGGEPTLYDDLAALCEKIQKAGYPIKLDTNGSRPDLLKKLLDAGLLDYIAMDIKTDPYGYSPYIVKNYSPDDIITSIRLIIESGVPHEFRTTCVKPFVNKEIIKTILTHIEGAALYALQRFQMSQVLHPDFFSDRDHDCADAELEKFSRLAKNRVKECVIR